MKWFVVLLLALVGIIYFQKRTGKQPENAAPAEAEPSLSQSDSTTPKQSAWQNITCPACKGDGAIMIRRVTNSEVMHDNREACSLCSGSGHHRIPSGRTVCPDCLGMGKRLMHKDIPPSVTTYRESLSRLHVSGYPQRGPTSTSCNRCLMKGYTSSPRAR